MVFLQPPPLGAIIRAGGMLMLRFTLNGQTVETDLAPDTLLWAVRDQFKLKGSKFGCGAGLCGACTMRGWSRAENLRCYPGGDWPASRDHHRRRIRRGWA